MIVYQFVELLRTQITGGLVQFGFFMTSGSVRFEFCVCFLLSSSSSVRFYPKWALGPGPLVRFVRFDSHLEVRNRLCDNMLLVITLSVNVFS